MNPDILKPLTHIGHPGLKAPPPGTVGKLRLKNKK